MQRAMHRCGLEIYKETDIEAVERPTPTPPYEGRGNPIAPTTDYTGVSDLHPI